MFAARAAATLRDLDEHQRALVDPAILASARQGEALSALDYLQAESDRLALVQLPSAIAGPGFAMMASLPVGPAPTSSSAPRSRAIRAAADEAGSSGALSLSEYRALAEFRWLIRAFLSFSERAARALGIEPWMDWLVKDRELRPGQLKLSDLFTNAYNPRGRAPGP